MLAAKPFDLWSILLMAIPENISSFFKNNCQIKVINDKLTYCKKRFYIKIIHIELFLPL